MRRARRAGIALVVAVALVVWAHATQRLIWYVGLQAGTPAGMSLIWHVDECDVGTALDAGGHEYGVCINVGGVAQ